MSRFAEFESHHRTALRAVAGADGTAQVSVLLDTDAGAMDAATSLPLAGPAQMVGLRSSAIFKRMPAPGAGDFRAGALPYVEFSDPSLPWAVALSDAPVIGLLCLPDTPELQVNAAAVPNPVLTLSGAAPLPAPALFRQMAHVQKTAQGRVARLLCPQELQPQMRYIAAIVPLTAAGLRAGLGEAPDPAMVGDGGAAWAEGAQSLRLPAFDWWRFSTGTGRGAEDILRDLRAHDIDGRPARLQLSAETAALLRQPADAQIDRATLFVEQPPALPELPQITEALTPQTPSGDRRMALPSYARQQAGARDAGEGLAPEDPVWFRQLNRTPSYRVMAGLGADIVRRHQDSCISFVRTAAGQIEDANALLSRAHLGMRTGALLQTAMDALPGEALIRLAGPALARTRLGADTAADRLTGRAEAVAADPVLRRRMGPGAMPQADPQTPPGSSLAGDIAAVSRRMRLDDGLAGTGPFACLDDTPAGPAGYFGSSARRDPRRAIAEMRDNHDHQTRSDPERDAPLRDARQRAKRDCRRPVGGATYSAGVRSELIRDLRHALRPDVSVPPRLRARIGGDPAMDQTPPPRRLRHDPVWPEPLVELLFDIDPSALAPGLDTLPPDSVTGLMLDGAALEALVAGANHELLRELAWRGLPVPTRTSPLRRAFPALEGAETRFDLNPIDSWDTRAPLGAGWQGRMGFFAVLRSDLFRLVPDMIVYLCPARWHAGHREIDPNTDLIYPLAMGELGPDMVYLGFETEADALRGTPEAQGDAGMFLVFETPSDGLSFGLGGRNGAAARDAVELAADGGWQSLDWDDLPGPALASDDLAGTEIDGVVWGRSAADMAAILMERPIVLALHGSDLLGPV